MLSRKTSNALFYGTLILILTVVLLIRFVTLGTLNAKIEDVTISNTSVKTQIDELSTIVQENKNTQNDHLFELYKSVPQVYNKSILRNFTKAQLELVGIKDLEETSRSVDVFEGDEVTFPISSVFTVLQSKFKVVEVEVYFNTLRIDVVDEFIDLLYENQQVFIVNSIEYLSPDGTLIGVTINFLAFYELEKES